MSLRERIRLADSNETVSTECEQLRAELLASNQKYGDQQAVIEKKDKLIRELELEIERFWQSIENDNYGSLQTTSGQGVKEPLQVNTLDLVGGGEILAIMTQIDRDSQLELDN